MRHSATTKRSLVKRCQACSHSFAERTQSSACCPRCGDTALRVLSEEPTLVDALRKARALREARA